MERFNVTYPVWKAVAGQMIYRIYHIDKNGDRFLMTGDRENLFESFAASGSAELTDFTTNFGAISTTALTKDDAVAQLVGLNPENEQKVQFYSPNYAYKPSWYEGSVFHSASALVTADSGSGSVWVLSEPQTVVDVSHRNLVFEYKHTQYQPKVYVDDVLLAEKDPDLSLGAGQWEMDYSTGQITLGTPASGSEVKMDFYEVSGSEFIVTPDVGTRLKITETEVQASLDLSIRTNFNFQLRGEVGKHPALAALRQANGGPYPDGVKIPLQTNVYSSMLCAVGESNLSYPRYLKTTNPNPSSRDLKDDIQIYSWDYAKQKEINLYAAWGMDLKVWMDDHIPQSGTCAIVTIYATSKQL